MFENFGPDISESQTAGRTFEQANVQLALEFGDAAADGRGRHAEPTRRLRKAVRLDDLGKNHERIEVCHCFLSRWIIPNTGNKFPLYPTNSTDGISVYFLTKENTSARE